MKAATARVSAIALLLGFMLILTGCGPNIVVTFQPPTITIVEGEPLQGSVTLTVKGVGLDWLAKVMLTFYDSVGNPMNDFEGNMEHVFDEEIPIPGLMGIVKVTKTFEELAGQPVYLPSEVWGYDNSQLPAKMRVTFINKKGSEFWSGQADLVWIRSDQ